MLLGWLFERFDVSAEIDRLICAGLGKSPAHGYLACGMNIMQMTKRIFLLVVVNILVMTTITLVLGLLHVGHYFPQGGLAGLAVFCLVWGFGGAFISLGLSRLMAKWMMGVQVIPPNTSRPHLAGTGGDRPRARPQRRPAQAARSRHLRIR